MPERADISNWRTTPFSEWAFAHVDEVLATATIGRGMGPVMELPQGEARLQDFRLAVRGERSLDMAGFLSATNTDGMVVLRDGRVVFEYYGKEMAEHTRHIIMSSTKSVAGLLAGVLAAQQVLRVDARVAEYLPELAETAYAGATVRELLDMRTGAAFSDDEQRAYEAANGWGPAAESGPADLHGFFLSLAGAERWHGGPFRYVSANTDLLGWVMERATGRRFADLVSALLWQPLGAEDDAYITVDASGAARATGGMCATVRDFARLGQLLVDGGRRGAEQVIPEEWLADIEQNGDREAWEQGEFAEGFRGMKLRYRSGWYVVEDEPKRLFAMGIHGQNLFVDRAHRIVIAKVSSQAEAVDYRASPLTHRAVVEMVRMLAG